MSFILSINIVYDDWAVLALQLATESGCSRRLKRTLARFRELPEAQQAAGNRGLTCSPAGGLRRLWAASSLRAAPSSQLTPANPHFSQTFWARMWRTHTCVPRRHSWRRSGSDAVFPPDEVSRRVSTRHAWARALRQQAGCEKCGLMHFKEVRQRIRRHRSLRSRLGKFPCVGRTPASARAPRPTQAGREGPGSEEKRGALLRDRPS